jgi:hypothetical protein
MTCTTYSKDILLLGKASKLIYKQDETHQDLVDKLKHFSLSTNYVRDGETTLNYISNPSQTKDYKLVIYDSVSNLYTFNDEGPQRIEFFKDKIINPLNAMQKPIIIFSDKYVGDAIKEINKENGFTHINQPYNIDKVVTIIHDLIK